MNDVISKPLVRKRLPLSELLQFAYPDELTAVVDIILNHEGGRLFHDNDVRQNLLKHRERGELNLVTDIIANEICHFGSSAILSLLRNGEPVNYDEVVRDVAKESKIKFSDKDEVADIEKEILLAQLTKMLAGKNREEIENLLISAGFTLGSSVIDSIINAKNASTLAISISSNPELFQLAKLMVSRTSLLDVSSTIATALGARTTSVIGAFAMVKAAYEKGSPSLVVILPAVVRIAAIRQRLIKADLDKFFMELRACL